MGADEAVDSRADRDRGALFFNEMPAARMRRKLTYWFLGSVLFLAGLAALVSENRSINFYAKCIDQFGKPAAGLKVEITVLGNGSSLATQ